MFDLCWQMTLWWKENCSPDDPKGEQSVGTREAALTATLPKRVRGEGMEQRTFLLMIQKLVVIYLKVNMCIYNFRTGYFRPRSTYF